MVLPSSKVTYFLIALVCVVISLLFIGRGQEGGNAVGKDVQDFLSHNIGSTNLSVIDYRNVPADKVPLSISQEIKHVAKKLLILAGISIERKSFAIEFDLQSPQNKEHVYCLFRMHGDNVLRIIIKASSKEDSSAIRLQELLEKSFPDYDVPILVINSQVGGHHAPFSKPNHTGKFETRNGLHVGRVVLAFVNGAQCTSYVATVKQQL
ncbi:MAG: hypothetical protein QX199_03690 [Methylococcaceae bacterium]